MRSAKKLEVHRNMHFDAKGRKIVTLENIEAFCTAWYVVYAVSKANFMDSGITRLKDDILEP